jgi:hypothetical protein
MALLLMLAVDRPVRILLRETNNVVRNFRGRRRAVDCSVATAAETALTGLNVQFMRTTLF